MTDIKDMVLTPENRHMALRTLALYAQRIGKVFASPTTWAKLVRERGWLRPRQRVHPAKPTVGVRATAPNEIWHVKLRSQGTPEAACPNPLSRQPGR